MDVECLCHIFLHELEHLRGRRHGKFSDGVISNLAKKIVDKYEDELPIGIIEEKKPEKKDLQMERYDHVMEMVKEKEMKIKRLNTQLKKWKVKQRYYENILMAAGKI